MDYISVAGGSKRRTFLEAADVIFNHLCTPCLKDGSPTNINGASKWTIKVVFVVFLNKHRVSLFLKPSVRSTFTWSDVNVEKSRTPAQLPYKASHMSVPAFLSISQRKETINETPEAQGCCNVCVFSLLTKIKSGPGRRVLKKHEIIFHHKTETGRVVYSRTIPVFLICDDYQQQSDIKTPKSAVLHRDHRLCGETMCVLLRELTEY